MENKDIIKVPQAAKAVSKVLCWEKKTELVFSPEGKDDMKSVKALSDNAIQILCDALIARTLIGKLSILHIKIDKGVDNLAKLLRQDATLKELYLNDNHFGDKHAESIAESLCSNTSLETLDLMHNLICDHGAKCLAKVFRSPNDPEVEDDLNNPGYTNSKIHTFCLDGNKHISAKGLSYLANIYVKNARPELKLTHFPLSWFQVRL